MNLHKPSHPKYASAAPSKDLSKNAIVSNALDCSKTAPTISGMFARTLLNLCWLCTKALRLSLGPSPTACWTFLVSEPKSPKPSPESSTGSIETDLASQQFPGTCFRTTSGTLLKLVWHYKLDLSLQHKFLEPLRNLLPDTEPDQPVQPSLPDLLRNLLRNLPRNILHPVPSPKPETDLH